MALNGADQYSTDAWEEGGDASPVGGIVWKEMFETPFFEFRFEAELDGHCRCGNECGPAMPRECPS